MHIALTNDDGFESEGIGRLREELIALGGRVTTVAPDGQRSAQSHRVTCREPLRVRLETPHEMTNPVYSCSGTPADCARIAILADTLWAKPDIVVSGINHGVNLGDDINYSGTVAAAIEAALLGVPAVALSQQPEGGGAPFINVSAHQFSYARIAAELVFAAAQVPAPDRTVLNVNLPHSLGDAQPVVTRLGRRHFSASVPTDDAGGEQWLMRPWASADFPEPRYDLGHDTDFAAVVAGHMSVTPLLAAPSPTTAAEAAAWAQEVIHAVSAARRPKRSEA